MMSSKNFLFVEDIHPIMTCGGGDFCTWGEHEPTRSFKKHAGASVCTEVGLS